MNREQVQRALTKALQARGVVSSFAQLDAATKTAIVTVAQLCSGDTVTGIVGQGATRASFTLDDLVAVLLATKATIEADRAARSAGVRPLPPRGSP